MQANTYRSRERNIKQETERNTNTEITSIQAERKKERQQGSTHETNKHKDKLTQHKKTENNESKKKAERKTHLT